jgi:hypothetical protein
MACTPSNAVWQGWGAEALLCRVCLKVVRDAMEASGSDLACGHVFCASCIVPLVADTEECPVCKKPLTNAMLRPNHTIRRLLAAPLSVRCPGCGEITCPYLQMVACPLRCGTVWPACSQREGTPQHRCPNTPYPCTTCGKWIKKADILDHLNACRWQGRVMQHAFIVPKGQNTDCISDSGINWHVRLTFNADGLTLEGVTLADNQVLYQDLHKKWDVYLSSITATVRHPVDARVISTVEIKDVKLSGAPGSDPANIMRPLIRKAELTAVGADDPMSYIDWCWVHLSIVVERITPLGAPFGPSVACATATG